MSNRVKDAAERNFQEKFVNELQKYKWQAPDFLNGNKQEVTVDHLINHWRDELNRINADMLEGVALTDGEFKQVLAKVSNISNSFEAAKILAIEGAGKIDGIYRDPNPKITRNKITLTIFKKAQVSGGDSSYKIAREVQTPNGNRFDVVLLINGLPLINVEMKRTDKTIDEAFGQFKRYYLAGEFSNNFMAFSQMMVITSEIATRYFATPKSLSDFNLAFVFHWADKENKPINDWQQIIEKFLMIPMAHQMVGDYLIIDEAEYEENKKIMLMRPYQVYALQSIEGAAMGWYNDGVPQGGFVWHTTGSGKTITSFKTALFLSTRAGFDKVVFLVDRRDLDSKTSEQFKSYSAYEPVIVDDTRSTYALGKRLKEPKRGIIVTTTFKMNSFVKEQVENSDRTVADKRIIFIIDEAHRTTMGSMMVAIQNYFKKNSLFYGFTGTPLFEENKVTGLINTDSEVINTTEKLFGPLLHQYSIDQAISDGNVLGFNVDYINTGEFIGYEYLRDKLVDTLNQERPNDSKNSIEKYVYGLSELNVEIESSKRELFKYQDETHIPRVVERILENWDEQSQNRKFNAILTVAVRQRVVDYFREFKKQMDEKNIFINIAPTFSQGTEKDILKIEPKDYEEMYNHYSGYTGMHFNYLDNNSNDDYFQDLVSRSTRGGSGRNPKNIDLIIVADQLLTGYDNKYLNTLYNDRNLKLQGLIQAYSRTNRIYGPDKEFGSIVNFIYPRITEENVKIALILYGSGGTNNRVIVEPYETAVSKFNLSLNQLRDILPIPSDWQLIKNDEVQKKRFKNAFKESSRLINFVMQYYEYKWDDDSFGIDEHTWLKYVGAYRNMIDPTKIGTEDVVPLVGKLKIANTQIIDAAHIINLIQKKVVYVQGIQTIDSETSRLIYEQIQELSDMGDHVQAQLLKEFVDQELIKGKIKTNEPFDVLFERWKVQKVQKDIEEFSKEWGLDDNLLKKSIKSYSRLHPEVIPYIEELARNVDFDSVNAETVLERLRHQSNLSDKLPVFIAEIKQKYNN